jgi:hypothetical protein
MRSLGAWSSRQGLVRGEVIGGVAVEVRLMTYSLMGNWEEVRSLGAWLWR